MTKRKPEIIQSLKPRYEDLEKNEPWTEHERTSFPARQKNFIRGIQITHGMSKQDAIDYFGRANLTSKERFKDLEKTVKTRLEKYASNDSGGKHVHPVFTTNDLKKEQGLLRNREKKELSEQEKVVKKKKRKVVLKNLPVSKWLKTAEAKSLKIYNRILNGHKLHPHASYYELRYGVNSIKSEAYRQKHDRPKKYEYND
jgi:hypothetical protein